MAIAPTDELTFDEDDLSPLVELLTDLAPGGWVNLIPEVEPGHEPPPRNPVVSVFSARGDLIPLATWSAPEVAGRRTTIGITHGSGPRALPRLSERGLDLPDGWLKVADHPRRGLVVTRPATSDLADGAWWLLAVGHALSVVPLTGSWLARRYAP